MTFWDTETFHDYERLCGDEPGTRARLLASAEFKTRVVDLSLSEAELWQGVRRSYRSLIHKGECDYEIRYFSNADIVDVCMNAIEHAQHVHRQAAGRDTRSAETWRVMADWIGSGNGLLVSAWASSRRCVGFVFCTIDVQHAYYFSGAIVDGCSSHALIWHAMKALKARGVRWLELGWQGEAHDAKGKQIEFYKRGFGGYDVSAKEAPCLASSV